jgi:hypothetical protein
MSDQTHSSVARAARHLGFRPEQIRILPTDRTFRMRPADLEAAMEADIDAGRIPFLAIANAGTTSTGAVDDLTELARVCRARGVWLHVDGAYGAFAILTDRGRAALDGLGLADSVTLDPHKWLAMPFEVGCLMVRDGAALERAFELHPEYLQDRGHDDRAVNFADRGLQLTRATRAIKVWLAIQTFGLGAFRATIDRAIDLTIEAQRRIEADDRLELLTPASLGIVTFRRRGEPGESPAAVDHRNERILASLAAGGDVLLTSTFIGGRYAIRMCVLNHSSDLAAIEFALDRVATADAPEVLGASGDGRGPSDRRERAARQAAATADWSGTHDLSVDDLRRVGVFESVSHEQAVRLLAPARETTVRAGDAVIERWALARTFYIVRTGRLEVRIDDRVVNTLGPGDHFGEVGAIDWGRDFGYARTATVVAVEDARLVTIPAAALRTLMAESPEVDRAIRRIAQERLAVG